MPNIVILTTETPHHAYFVREIAKYHSVVGVVIETDTPSFPFETQHVYEDRQNAYEREVFFSGADVSLESLSDFWRTNSANDADAIDFVRSHKPDIIIVFGTAKLKGEILTLCPNEFLNLHGGDPEEYRGLNSHLWAIYHRDFGAVVTTLHHVNQTLDDGSIVLRGPVPLRRGMKLHELRAESTRVCVSLTRTALTERARTGRFAAQAQRHRGRYYSAMPSALKEICVNRFDRYTRTITGNDC